MPKLSSNNLITTYFILGLLIVSANADFEASFYPLHFGTDLRSVVLVGLPDGSIVYFTHTYSPAKIYYQKFGPELEPLTNVTLLTTMGVRDEDDSGIRVVLLNETTIFITFTVDKSVHYSLYDLYLNPIVEKVKLNNFVSNYYCHISKLRLFSNGGIAISYNCDPLTYLTVLDKNLNIVVNNVQYYSQKVYTPVTFEATDGDYYQYFIYNRRLKVHSVENVNPLIEMKLSVDGIKAVKCSNGNIFLTYIDYSINEEYIRQVGTNYVSFSGTEFSHGESIMHDFECIENDLYTIKQHTYYQYKVRRYDQSFNLISETLTNISNAWATNINLNFLPQGALLISGKTDTYIAGEIGCLKNYPGCPSRSKPHCTPSTFTCDATDGCSSDSDCTFPGYTKCINASPKHCGCNTNADCPYSTRPYCNPTTRVCSPYCSFDVDCNNNINTISSTCLKTVQPYRCSCTQNSDCLDANLPVCDPTSGICRPKCLANSECSANTDGTRCITSVNPIRCGCSSDADCSSNSNDLKCDLTSNVCVPRCMSNADCAGTDGPVCDKSTIPYKCMCPDTASCSSYSIKKLCDASSRLCIEGCSANPDCTSNGHGTLCNTAVNPNKCGCSDDSHCTQDLNRTVCKNSKCDYLCASEADCSSSYDGPVCLGNATITVKCGCSYDSDCAKFPSFPKCSLTLFKCVMECETSSECSSNSNGANCLYGPSAVYICGCSSDSDCTTDPSKSKCDLTTKRCKPPSCSSDSSCSSNPDGVKCITTVTPSTCGCRNDADCTVNANKPRCYVATGKCGPACTVNGDCSTSGQGKVCITSASPVTCGCNSNADCTNDPNKPKCDTTSKQCVPACSANSECSSNALGVKCLTSLNPIKCGCSSDADCTVDPTKKTCDVNTCSSICQRDTGCTGNGDGVKCITTRSPAICGCSTNTDCSADSTKPRCDATSSVCDIPCRTNAHCATNGNGIVCISSTSPVKCGCNSNSDCTQDPNKPKCDTSTKQCVPACSTDGECSADSLGVKCLMTASPYKCGCSADADCTVDSFKNKCDTNVKACAAFCGSDTDCTGFSDGVKCLLTRSPAVCGCSSNTDCTADINKPKCGSNGACRVACIDSSECSTDSNGAVCLTSMSPVQCGCNSDADCTTDTNNPKCNTSTKKCVPACAADSECSTNDNGVKCLLSKVPIKCGCQSNSDCLSSSSKNTCNTDGNCIKTCTSNTQCSSDPDGLACITSGQYDVCGCQSNSDCDSASDKPRCNLGTSKCEQACFNNTGCSSNSAGFVCLLTASPVKCGCNSNVDCPFSSPKCSNNQCVPLCSASTPSDCASNTNGVRCLTTNGIAQCGCSSDSDCSNPSKSKCDLTNKVCVAACTANSDCNGKPDGNKCMKELLPSKCGCDVDEHCNNTATPFCNTAKHVCVPPCQSDFDCQNQTAGPKCLLNLPVPRCGCNMSNDCNSSAFGSFCMNSSTCGCAFDNHCLLDSTKPRCDLENDFCVADVSPEESFPVYAIALIAVTSTTTVATGLAYGIKMMKLAKAKVKVTPIKAKKIDMTIDNTPNTSEFRLKMESSSKTEGVERTTLLKSER